MHLISVTWRISHQVLKTADRSFSPLTQSRRKCKIHNPFSHEIGNIIRQNTQLKKRIKFRIRSEYELHFTEDLNCFFECIVLNFKC